MKQRTPSIRARSTRRLCVLAACLLAAGAGRAGPSVSYSLLDEEPGEYTLVANVVAEKGWTDESEVRLAFDVSGEDDLAYVRVRGTKAALFRVRGAEAEQVGQPRPVPATKSWEAVLQRRDGRVRFIAGARVVIDAEWDGPVAGRAGTWTSGGVEASDAYVQPYAPPVLRDDFTREPDEMGPWEVLDGTCRNTMVSSPKADPTRSANPFGFRVAAEPQALASTGLWFWDTYRVSASVRPLDARTVSLAVYVQDRENMLQLRWAEGAPDARRAKQLVLLRDGKESVLAAAEGGFDRDQWYRLEMAVSPGKVEAFIDRYPVLSAETDAFGQGPIGICCEDGEAVFDDIVVAATDSPALHVPRINPVFVADEVMAQMQLYTPAGQWRDAGQGAHWNWGYYAGDVSVHLDVKPLSTPVTVLLRGDGSSLENAYAVTLAREEDTLSVSLKRPPDKLIAGSCAAQLTDVATVTAAGNTVRVSCAGTQALAFTDDEPLTGKMLGLVGATTELINSAIVTSPQFLDYGFDAAPTDWLGGKGIWQVTTRWPCQPGWTFFGGTHDENPVLWTKHSYAGDTALEFFANIRMDVPPPPGYSRPSDVNAALCADGIDLGSGYAFIFAGWKNTKSAILRQGHVVAETADAVFVNPNSSNGEFHRHWFRIRAEKIGSRVALSIDGREILSYDDPDPLPAGRAGIWSFHNGVMVGRARLWFAEERRGGVPTGRVATAPSPEPEPRPEDAPVSNDFETGVGEWQTFSTPSPVELALDNSTSAAGKRSLRISNHVSGGAMGVYAVVTAFRAADFPRLGFDYRIPPGVAVNVYVYAGRQWHAIRLSADEPELGATPTLGAIEGVQRDDAWHHAEFDLLTPLASAHPESKVLTVKYVAFAAPEESYVRCGIGGNRLGATYWIDNFRIGP